MTCFNSESVDARAGSATSAAKGVTTQLEVKKYLGARNHNCIKLVMYHEEKSQPTSLRL